MNPGIFPAPRLDGPAPITLKQQLRILAPPGRSLTLDISAVEGNPAAPIALPLAA